MKTQLSITEMCLTVSALGGRSTRTMERIIQVVVDQQGEAKVEAKYTYRPGVAGSMYQQNGDPGDPPEPDEVELESLTPTADMLFDAPGIRVTLLAGHDMADYLMPNAMEDLLIELAGDAQEQLADAKAEAKMEARLGRMQ